LMPHAIATPAMEAPGWLLASTALRLNSGVWVRLLAMVSA
jgi:hypothetical protein